MKINYLPEETIILELLNRNHIIVPKRQHIYSVFSHSDFSDTILANHILKKGYKTIQKISDSVEENFKYIPPLTLTDNNCNEFQGTGFLPTSAIFSTDVFTKIKGCTSTKKLTEIINQESPNVKWSIYEDITDWTIFSCKDTQSIGSTGILYLSVAKIYPHEIVSKISTAESIVLLAARGYSIIDINANNSISNLTDEDLIYIAGLHNYIVKTP